MSAFASASAAGGAVAAPGAPKYVLTSDIAQFCFPAASQDANRKYAYACSIYLSFLVIGLVGIVGARKVVVRELPPLVEQIIEVEPVVEQQPPVQVATQQEEVMEQRSDAPTDAPPMPVLVAPANANVPFAVPTEGYVAVTKLVARAAAPPLVAPKPPPPVVAPPPPPSVFKRGSGSRPRGSFVEPPFPAGMLRSGQTAELTLRVELAEDGTPDKVEVETTCGIYELDRKVAQHVKSRWKWEPGQAKVWLIPFAFQCR